MTPLFGRCLVAVHPAMGAALEYIPAVACA
jgi:hypothetical protein